MTLSSHGGRRLGAGRPKIADEQLTVRVTSAASESVKALGQAHGVAAGVRYAIDLAASVTVPGQTVSEVCVSFQPLADSKATTVEEALEEIFQWLHSCGHVLSVYKCGREALTVRARMPLGNSFSLWLSVPARRLKAPTPKEYQADLRKIKEFLVARGFQFCWAE